MRKGSCALALITVCAALTCSGCQSSGSTPNSTATTQPQPVSIPANSPWAKVTVGMDMNQVIALLGQPTSTGSQMTGKGLIPFYMGGDAQRFVSHYKGHGRIIYTRPNGFATNWTALEVQYDPAEPN